MHVSIKQPKDTYWLYNDADLYLAFCTHKKRCDATLALGVLLDLIISNKLMYYSTQHGILFSCFVAHSLCLVFAFRHNDIRRICCVEEYITFFSLKSDTQFATGNKNTPPTWLYFLTACFKINYSFPPISNCYVKIMISIYLELIS